MKIAIYLTGSTYTDISCKYGDFEDWFARGVNKYGFDTVTVDVTRGDRPDLTEIDGIIITGSPASVCSDPAPWVEETIEHLQELLRRDFPTLGVCFGHQILATAAGCKVQPHPVGRELGTVNLSLTFAGEGSSLFQDIPKDFLAHETHEDVVWQIPPDSDIQVLAMNEYNKHQALKYSEYIYSVQFHPEITAEIMNAYIAIYGKRLQLDGDLSDEEYHQIAGNVQDSITGGLIFRNFCGMISERRKTKSIVTDS